jgi:hypothetical protein
MSTNTLKPRNRAEALRDVDYALRMGLVHERLYSRLHRGLRFIELFGSSAAFGAVMGDKSILAMVIMAGVAAAAYLGMIYEFGDGARLHREAMARCNKVVTDALSNPGMTAEEIDLGRAYAASVEVPIVEALRVPCYNAVQRRHGLMGHVKPLSWVERVMQAIA